MTMATIQNEFCDALRDAPSLIASRISTRSQHGLAVYRNNYEAQLRDCLGDLYERTWSYIGDDSFYEATVFHRGQRPPKSWTLDRYGDDFDLSVAALYPDDPDVPELAWIEWALRRVFSGPDAAAPALRLVGGATEPTLALHPTVLLRPVVTNAAAIWSGLGEGAPPEAQRLSAPTAILVWRNELVPQFRSVMGDELVMLTQLVDGETFDEACDAMFGDQDPQRVLAQFQATLGQWLAEGVLVESAVTDSTGS